MFAILMTGCTKVGSSAGSGARNPWTQPGVLRIAVAGTIKSLNPLLSTTTTEALAETFVLDPLIATDPEGRDVPVLAERVPTLENGDIAKDGLTITYRLRKHVRWQDGAMFTSRDVKFSFRAIMNSNTAITSRHGYDLVSKIDTPDDFTVVLHLKHPFAPAVHTFFAHSDTPYEIVPAHLLERYKSLDRVPFNERPIGTGPFRVLRWARGDRIEYIANEQYFLGAPKINRIEIHFVQDENTMANQLKSHEIDWFYQPTATVYPQLKGLLGIETRLVPFNGYDAIQFNVSKPPVDDVRVRRAIGLVIDKRALIEKLTFGTALPATEDLPSFMWAFNPSAGTDKRDLPAAKALLESAGWHAGPAGMRTRSGKPLQIGLSYHTDSAIDRRRVVLIAGMLREAGIAAEPKGYNITMYYASAAEKGIMATGNFEAALTQWYAGIDPDNSTQLLCDQFPPAGWNWSRYCNPKMDAAQRIALTHYDLPTRKRAYATIEKLLADDAPYVYLQWPRQDEAVNSDLKNFRPNGIVENWNAYAWSI